MFLIFALASRLQLAEITQTLVPSKLGQAGLILARMTRTDIKHYDWAALQVHLGYFSP